MEELKQKLEGLLSDFMRKTEKCPVNSCQGCPLADEVSKPYKPYYWGGGKLSGDLSVCDLLSTLVDVEDIK